MFLSKSIHQVQVLVKQALVKNEMQMVSDIALKLELTEGEVTLALPEEMLSSVAGEYCELILQEIADWENVTTIVHSFGSIFEFKGRFPKGKSNLGYYNIMGKEGLHGHLRIDLIKHIAFVSKPFCGKESHYIGFFETKGNCVFKVYVGRDKKRQLLVEQVQSFHKIKSTLIKTTSL